MKIRLKLVLAFIAMTNTISLPAQEKPAWLSVNLEMGTPNLDNSLQFIPSVGLGVKEGQLLMGFVSRSYFNNGTVKQSYGGEILLKCNISPSFFVYGKSDLLEGGIKRYDFTETGEAHKRYESVLQIENGAGAGLNITKSISFMAGVNLDEYDPVRKTSYKCRPNLKLHYNLFRI